MKTQPPSSTRNKENVSKPDQAKKVTLPSSSGKSKGNPIDAGQLHIDCMLPICELEIEETRKLAEKGDLKAVMALHRTAARAAAVLNQLDFSLQQKAARSSEWWPVNLSCVSSWNNTMIRQIPAALGLGKGLNPIFDMEAVLKRGARTNMLGSALVSFVEECRRLGVLMRELSHGQVKELGETLPDEIEAKLVRRYNCVRGCIDQVAGYMNLKLPALFECDKPSQDAEMALIKGLSMEALLLPPLLASKESREAWFDFGMCLIKYLAEAKYEDPKFSLIKMNRKAKASSPGDIRAGIRQGIKEGFDAVIRNVSPEGFIKVN